jgi:hypothetical protein
MYAGLVRCLVSVTVLAYVAAASCTRVPIEIQEGAASPTFSLFPPPDQNMKPGWAKPSPHAPLRLFDMARLLDGDEIRSIRVDKYLTSQFPTPEAVRQVLLRLWGTEVDAPESYIAWAESSWWSIQCRIELKSGKSAYLTTDGWHSCYQNAQGYRWFFRGTVDEAKRLFGQAAPQ